jgi:hypothetical protein
MGLQPFPFLRPSPGEPERPVTAGTPDFQIHGESGQLGLLGFQQGQIAIGTVGPG